MRQGANEFTEPFQILCEGPSDAAFFRALLAKHGILNFGVRAAVDALPPEKRGGGNSTFGPALRSFVGSRGFPIVRNILVISDIDSSENVSFAEIQRQIAALASDPDDPITMFEVPQQPRVMVESLAPGGPSLTVLMIPLNGQPGNLETII